MVAAITRMTAEEFDRWVELPNNYNKLFEYIGGEIVEAPSNVFASIISQMFSGFFFIYLRSNPIAHLSGEAGGYYISGERYAPDVAIILKSRQPQVDKRGYNRVAPDLVVEVDFPSTYESQEELRVKIANYLAAGTTVWLARPEAPQNRRIEVYAPGESVRLLGMADMLDGGTILPGFTLAVKEVFPDSAENQTTSN